MLHRPERGKAGCQHSSTAGPSIWANCRHVHSPAGMHLVRHGMPQSEQRITGVMYPRNMGQLPPIQSRYAALKFDIHGPIHMECGRGRVLGW